MLLGININLEPMLCVLGIYTPRYIHGQGSKLLAESLALNCKENDYSLLVKPPMQWRERVNEVYGENYSKEKFKCGNQQFN